MNYIKLTIGGKERGFKFGLGFLGEAFNNLGFTVTELDTELSKNPFKVIPELMYQSALYNCLRSGEKPDFDKYIMSDWIDEAGGLASPVVLEFLQGITKSMTKDVPKEDLEVVEEEGAKKK
jgi:hypothetical protein